MKAACFVATSRPSRTDHPLGRFQLRQSRWCCGGRGVSLTKHGSHTLVPFFSVKSTLRLESISAPHFPQDSVWASLIPTSCLSRPLDFILRALAHLSPQDKQPGHSVLYCDSLFAKNLFIQQRTSPNRTFRCPNAVRRLALIRFEYRVLVRIPPSWFRGCVVTRHGSC